MGNRTAEFRPWSETELTLLRQLHPLMPYGEIAKRMHGRSYDGIKAKARQLRLPKERHTWTGAEVRDVRDENRRYRCGGPRGKRREPTQRAYRSAAGDSRCTKLATLPPPWRITCKERVRLNSLCTLRRGFGGL